MHMTYIHTKKKFVGLWPAYDDNFCRFLHIQIFTSLKNLAGTSMGLLKLNIYIPAIGDT